MIMAKRRKKRSDVLEILDRRVPPTATDLKMREVFRERMDVAELIHAARTNAGLTQGQLAKRVGTTTSVISRLEDSEYEGHSMTMLRRIAEALGQRVEVRFVPDAGRQFEHA